MERGQGDTATPVRMASLMGEIQDSSAPRGASLIKPVLSSGPQDSLVGELWPCPKGSKSDGRQPNPSAPRLVGKTRPGPAPYTSWGDITLLTRFTVFHRIGTIIS